MIDEPIENPEYRRRKNNLNSKYFHLNSKIRQEFAWELLNAGIITKEHFLDTINLAIGLTDEKVKQYKQELDYLIAAYK